MKSMTGYGLGKSQSTQTQIEVSLRTVNGRFLETRFHLPREFIAFESELKKKIEKYFERGTMDIFVSRKTRAAGGGTKVVVNRELAKQYKQAYAALAKDLGIQASVHLEAIARLPDVMKIEEASDVSGAEKKALFEAFEKACKACVSERLREGKSLKKNLSDNLGILEKEIDEIQTVREEVNQGLLHRFEQKIKTKLTGVEVDSTRLSQEVVIQLEKSDINEELIRLKEHIRNYRHLLSENQAQGKKLDFYTQELLREVNTIGSKSSVSKLTQIVVQAKTLIERLREQVQNVE